MDAKYAVTDIAAALKARALPTVTVWNRLEGRPRKDDFSRALKAEVRDPLWMLTKQWQLGEFRGEDAGSPVFAKLRLRTSPVTRYQANGGASEPFPSEIPLETQVERRPIRWQWNGQRMHLDLRAQAGRQWRKLLEAATLTPYLSQFRARYPFQVPALDETTDYVFAHRNAWQQFAALAGRSVDGGELHVYLSAAPTHRASDGIVLADPLDGPKLDAVGDELQRWFAALYSEPTTSDAWKPPYLEYQFACSAPQAGREQVLAASEYAQGHIDWYSFDRATGDLGGSAAPGAEEVTVKSFIPKPITFEGAPDPRWWTLEDRKTNFGAVKPSTTDLAQLLLMEFALVYANDWFLVPFEVPAGTLARIEGLAVTNNFGERTWLLAAGAGEEDNWHRWAMFQQSTLDARGLADTSLLIPPVIPKPLEGAPLEEIELARDEVANMAWAIETTVPSLIGVGRSGKDEARETRQFYERLVAAGPPTSITYRAPIAYRAMTSVPEHFIPFVPVHVPGSVREIQLQRSRMLRVIEGDPLPPEKVPPRTTLMREGLDLSPKLPYFIHEEEVQRAGTRLTQGFRRARWTGGQAYVWLGVQKRTGRGERRSGLAFDTLADTAGAK
jgi:hypothetical protein